MDRHREQTKVVKRRAVRFEPVGRTARVTIVDVRTPQPSQSSLSVLAPEATLRPMFEEQIAAGGRRKPAASPSAGKKNLRLITAVIIVLAVICVAVAFVAARNTRQIAA